MVFRRHACSLRCWTSSLWMRRSSRITRLPAGGRFVGFATRGMCFLEISYRFFPFHSLVFCGALCWNRAVTNLFALSFLPLSNPVRGVMISLMSLSPASLHATDVAPVNISLPVTSRVWLLTLCICSLSQVHTPAAGNNNEASTSHAASRADTPSSAASNEFGGKGQPTNGTGTSTPTSLKDGNIVLECVQCSRQVRVYLTLYAMMISFSQNFSLCLSRLRPIDTQPILVHVWVLTRQEGRPFEGMRRPSSSPSNTSVWILNITNTSSL